MKIAKTLANFAVIVVMIYFILIAADWLTVNLGY